MHLCVLSIDTGSTYFKIEYYKLNFLGMDFGFNNVILAGKNLDWLVRKINVKEVN